MLSRVNEVGTIDPIREMHYKFHHKINPALFPQVHDFYEIALVTDGIMEMTVNQKTETIKAGTLLLLRPGDVHDRKDLSGTCTYINLAFSNKIITQMFQYLDMPDMQHKIMQLSNAPKAILSSGETVLLKMQLEKLNLCPINQPHIVNIELRRLVLNILMQYFIPPILEQSEVFETGYPYWLNVIVEKLEDPELFSIGLDELSSLSGYTKEHLCREFRKYLGVSPTTYINAKRLNYAANLLRHSDQKVIDIAYASGFQSLSRFYHAFKKEFQVSALEYRKGKE